VAKAGTGAFELPIDLPSRIADKPGRTSPEELLAAAHAGCYSTSLAGEIARAGGTVERLNVACTVTLDEVGDKGHLIVSSELDVRARAEGIDAAGLERAVQAADEGCTFSALIRASASVSVRAELESN
jgi:osmotically inducible protein OsmC